MKTKKIFTSLRLISFVLLILLSPAFAVNAQRIFNIDNPEGTYVVTDYLNRKITLKIGKVEGHDVINIAKGRGSISINGRTLKGNWSVSEMNNKYFLCFNTYDNIKISYSLPSGTVKSDQIIISEDGRASYNISELLKTDADCVKAKRKIGSNSNSKKNKSTPKQR